MLNHRQRGQALIETALFLPLLLLALFGIIYISQAGVLGERLQVAVRYGGMVAFSKLGLNYGAANIYASINLASLPASCTSPSTAVLTYAAPFPGPTSHPFWNPAGTPIGSCTVVLGNFGSSPSSFAAITQSMSASTYVPLRIQAAIGASSTSAASETFVHAAYPAVIMYCDKSINDLVAAATSGGTPAPGANATPNPNVNC